MLLLRIPHCLACAYLPAWSYTTLCIPTPQSIHSSFAAVESVQNQGKICILDIDIQGVQNVKKSSLNPIYLFIAPPSMQELEKRLRGRGTEKEESIQKRLGNAAKELEYGQQAGNFDRVFINADLQSTFEDVATAFLDWYPQLVEYAPDDVHKSCQPNCVISWNHHVVSHIALREKFCLGIQE